MAGSRIVFYDCNCRACFTVGGCLSPEVNIFYAGAELFPPPFFLWHVSQEMHFDSIFHLFSSCFPFLLLSISNLWPLTAWIPFPCPLSRVCLFGAIKLFFRATSQHIHKHRSLGEDPHQSSAKPVSCWGYIKLQPSVIEMSIAAALPKKTWSLCAETVGAEREQDNSWYFVLKKLQQIRTPNKNVYSPTHFYNLTIFNYTKKLGSDMVNRLTGERN